MGAFEANPVFVDVDPNLVFGLYDFEWDVYQPYFEKYLQLMPKASHVGYKSIICGPETFTPDFAPIFGRTPEVNYSNDTCDE